MIFKAKAIADQLQLVYGPNTYMYHQVLRALEGNPHGLTKSELATLRKIIMTNATTICKQLK